MENCSCAADWRYASRCQNVLQFAGADHGIHFRNALTNLIAEALDQAARHDQLLRPSCGLKPGHLENRVH